MIFLDKFIRIGIHLFLGMANLTTNFLIRPNDNRGMYFEQTRRVLIYLPQHENIEDIYKTNTHEILHYCIEKSGVQIDEEQEEKLIFNMQWANYSIV